LRASLLVQAIFQSERLGQFQLFRIAALVCGHVVLGMLETVVYMDFAVPPLDRTLGEYASRGKIVL
jgi:hypothetical protein